MLISKQEFNQNYPQNLEQNEPVFITDHGQITNVVLRYDDYQKIQQQLANQPSVASLLSCEDTLEDDIFETYFTKVNIDLKPLETDS